jgi:hypothetical protein
MKRPSRSSSAPRQSAAQGKLVVRKSFDYASLDAGMAAQVQTAAHRIRQRIKQSMEILVAVGNDLLAVKQVLPHGSFGPWMRTEFGWAERTARNLMRVAQRFGPKSAILADLPIDATAAYLLAAPSVPDEAIVAALDRAQNGERITPSAANEIIRSFRRNAVHRATTASTELPPEKLWGQLLEVLESFRRHWDARQVAVLAEQLKDFADSLN